MDQYRTTLERQKEYFRSGRTLPYEERKKNLRKLRNALRFHENELIDALRSDLGKSPFEAYATEIGIVYGEIGYLLKNLGRLMRKHRKPSPITIFKASSYTVAEPLGNTLIFSPWNYPLQLTMVPIAGAIAGGNTAIVKPSRYSAATSALMKRIIEETFTSEYIAVFEGGHETNSALLDLKYDFVFFTGSPNVGRIVAENCASKLTPCVLELGGKSPVIIDGTVDMKLVSRRLAWGKLLNAGQTCVAPDYVLVKNGYQDKLIEELGKRFSEMFGGNPIASSEFPKIINEKHFDRINGLIASSSAVVGGGSDRSSMKIEPTVLYPVKETDAVMQEEIFGPVLPILTYDTLDEAMDFIRKREKPLALYIFSNDNTSIEKVHSLVSFGGGCINDTVIHLTNPRIPFGGVGGSGMGAYHGDESFRAFTHRKSIIKEATWIDLPIRFAPFKDKIKLVRLLMR